ncbi:MAG: FAD/NAD(P)-binding oxidoreductase [Kineosporiaceae bacterium]
MSVSRRQFVQNLGALSALGLTAGLAGRLPTSEAATGARSVPATTVPTGTGISGRVVVIGGGMAGTSVARYLRLWGGDKVQVTLVERNAAYTSNIMSNGVLTGQSTMSTLRYSHATLASRYGVSVVTAEAQAVDAGARTVRLSTGSSVPYDRLVVAPGLVFDALPGLSAGDYDTRFPHAWQAGAQTTLLRQQLLAMPAKGTYVMTIPAAPYRCPPGPYERACLVADWLKKNKPGSKVVVLDANPKIIAEPIAFGHAFTATHAGVVQYVPNAMIDHVDAARRTVYTSAGNFTADVLNPIPPHRAGAIAQNAGLVNVGGRWAGVDVLSYESTAVPGIHVIGDTIGTTQPKSGHMANAQGKVAADAITRLLSGQPVGTAPVTSSACYSPITMSTASWLTGVFQYDPATKTMVTTSISEAPSVTAGNYSDMSKWFRGLMNDTFA